MAVFVRLKLKARRIIPKRTKLEVVCRRIGWRCEECGEKQNYQCYQARETNTFTGGKEDGPDHPM